jgi:hypothetical protein
MCRAGYAPRFRHGVEDGGNVARHVRCAQDPWRIGVGSVDEQIRKAAQGEEAVARRRLGPTFAVVP